MATSANPPTIPSNELKYVKLIGEGGFSSVYQMTWMHPSLGPVEIAAKMLIKRDVTELEMMKDLDHPNIVKLLGVVDEPMEFMLILELCDRGSLRSYLKELNGQRLSDEQFLDWAEQAAKPLGYLRERRIVHKDVKSPNYMITADNNLKLGDFGIAKNLANTTHNATTSASYPWMAPELLRDGVLSHKYDIFAYGVIVWELRTGKCPFEGLEFQVVTWRVCNDNERLPIPDDCPQPIKDLMMQCWETDWKKRPDIEEVIEMIKRAAEVDKLVINRQSPSTPDRGLYESEISEVSDRNIADNVQKVLEKSAVYSEMVSCAEHPMATPSEDQPARLSSVDLGNNISDGNLSSIPHSESSSSRKLSAMVQTPSSTDSGLHEFELTEVAHLTIKDCLQKVLEKSDLIDDAIAGSPLTAKHPGFKYDFYAVYNRNCTRTCNWVHHHLCTQLENPYKGCIPERDFTIGKAIMKNIEDAINKSAKILLIISNGCFDDPWCEEAITRAMEPGAKHKVVPILLDYVPLPSYLKKLSCEDATTTINWKRIRKHLENL